MTLVPPFPYSPVEGDDGGDPPVASAASGGTGGASRTANGYAGWRQRQYWQGSPPEKEKKEEGFTMNCKERIEEGSNGSAEKEEEEEEKCSRWPTLEYRSLLWPLAIDASADGFSLMGGGSGSGGGLFDGLLLFDPAAVPLRIVSVDEGPPTRGQQQQNDNDEEGAEEEDDDILGRPAFSVHAERDEDADLLVAAAPPLRVEDPLDLGGEDSDSDPLNLPNDGINGDAFIGAPSDPLNLDFNLDLDLDTAAATLLIARPISPLLPDDDVAIDNNKTSAPPPAPTGENTSKGPRRRRRASPQSRQRKGAADTTPLAAAAEAASTTSPPLVYREVNSENYRRGAETVRTTRSDFIIGFRSGNMPAREPTLGSSLAPRPSRAESRK